MQVLSLANAKVNTDINTCLITSCSISKSHINRLVQDQTVLQTKSTHTVSINSVASTAMRLVDALLRTIMALVLVKDLWHLVTQAPNQPLPPLPHLLHLGVVILPSHHPQLSFLIHLQILLHHPPWLILT